MSDFFEKSDIFRSIIMTEEQREREYVLHTWTAQQDWHGPTVTGGQGAWFWDAQGRRYLDFSSQAECSNLGHQHPRVVQAIQEQAARLCYVSNAWGAQPRAELAERVVALANAGLPSDATLSYSKVFFTCDGAEAVENAVKMARWVTGRQKIIARYRSYHGATHAAMSIGADARGWNTPAGLHDVVHVLPPYCYRCPFGVQPDSCGVRCAEHVEEVIHYEGPHTIAAIIAEPAAGTNGIAPPPDYWQRLRQICDHYGILLIADEVMSGFGRTGAWFAWQRLGAAPDLFTLAKGITGAHIPLGAVCVSRKVADFFETRVLETGLTYSGHPLACAAGVAALRAYADEGLIERAASLGDVLFARLRQVQDAHACIGDVRGMGLFAIVEMKEFSFPRPLAWLKRLQQDALQRGLSLAVRGNMLIISPPLVIEQADLLWGLDVIDSLLPTPQDGQATSSRSDDLTIRHVRHQPCEGSKPSQG
jgi:taurine--2-oxoglutarate transaminase